MATCKNCLYFEVCAHRYERLCKGTKVEDLNHDCTKFKDRTKYVEVVRCQKCQWFSKKGYEEHNRQQAMPELDLGYCSVLYRVVQACYFCSYGERKDNA